MTKFYTKTGDDGYTGLLGEGRTPKYDLRIEAIGALDEANAALGVSRSICIDTRVAVIILAAQRDLYHIMTELAVQSQNASQFPQFSEGRVTWLEEQIDLISQETNIPSEFIVPGDSNSGATIDLARAIIRRAERLMARLLHEQIIANRELLRYINRLSSLCFALELLENQTGGHNQPTLAKG